MLRLSCLFLATLTAALAADRPNVLFITADDLGLQLSSYGETLIDTPHMDKLAASGARFETAYVAQASCSASRSAMFTGMYVHSTGQYGLTGPDHDRGAHHRLHPYLQRATIPNLLKREGYRTGIIGKLHVGPDSSFEFDYHPKVNTRVVKSVAEKAGVFLEETGARPFFLMINYSDPHAFRNSEAPGGWDFPPQIEGVPANPLPPGPNTIFDFQQIDTEAMRVRTAGYYNAVQRLDDGIGMLMEVLRGRGLIENTLIIFVGDHGPPFGRGKTTVYESGVRVPFFVKWPGVSKAGLVSPAMVSTVDVLPTILDAVSMEIPGHVQGKSLRPVVQDAKAPWRQYLVAEFHFHGTRPFYPRRAIRDQRYKLIHNLRAGEEKPSTGIDGSPAYRTSKESRYDGTDVQKAFATFADPPEFELYDLAEDPIEFHNLSGDPKYNGEVERLKAALMQWRWTMDDPFLDPAMMRRYIAYSKELSGN